MPQFAPSSVHKATATFSNPKSVGFDYTASLCMGADYTVMATVSFHLDAGQSKPVTFSVTMPAVSGTYPVYISVSSGGKVVALYKATEDVVIVEAPVGPLPPSGNAGIWGYVTESLTGVAVPDVKITLNGLVTKTYWAGQYEIRDIAAKQYLITFSKEGYETVSRYVTATNGTQEFTELNISLPPIIPAKPTLVYAYPAEAQMPSGGTGHINYKVGISDITTGNWLFFLFGVEGFYWWTPYACANVDFRAGAVAGYYEGSAPMYLRYMTDHFKFANIPRGTYRLLCTCELYRDSTLVKTYWKNVDTGQKIMVV